MPPMSMNLNIAQTRLENKMLPKFFFVFPLISLDQFEILYSKTPNRGAPLTCVCCLSGDVASLSCRF